jgi:hypothetical protein
VLRKTKNRLTLRVFPEPVKIRRQPRPVEKNALGFFESLGANPVCNDEGLQ